MKTSIPTSSAGMSLVELLTSVAIVGVITAIAIPNIANLTGSANAARDRQNAQYVVSVASALRATGYTNSWMDEDALIEELTTGVTYQNMTFNLSQLTPEAVNGAKQYFRVEDNLALYEPYPEE